MQRPSYFSLLAWALAAASLAACSRATYSFPSTASAYARAEQSAPPARSAAARAPADEAVATTETATLVAGPPAAHRAATALAKHRHALNKPASAVTEAPEHTPAVSTKAATKQAAQWLLRSPREAQAAGKSQVVAALLCFFLGVLGIHRFYLGYTGLGILELLTAGLFGILVLVDFIRIVVSDLKPKQGEYTRRR